MYLSAARCDVTADVGCAGEGGRAAAAAERDELASGDDGEEDGGHVGVGGHVRQDHARLRRRHRYVLVYSSWRHTGLVATTGAVIDMCSP